MWVFKNFGRIVNGKTVLRLMNKYNLLAKIRRNRHYKKASSHTVFHSDHGRQYSGKAYNEITSKNEIIPSMSRPGTPIDSSPIENFFSILKSECCPGQAKL